MNQLIVKSNIIFIFFLFIKSVSASVIINQTRVIYPSAAKNINVQLINKSLSGHLIQSWIDEGSASAKPEDIRTPLLVSPPVVKISPNGGQTLRITSTGNITKLPKDRESVFWLNVLDVPPMPEKKDANYVQVALRNRIKIFWRPENLAILLNDIPRHVGIRIQGSSYCVDNQTPYYLTIVQIMRWDGSSIKVQQGNRFKNLLKKTLFVPPFSCQAPENTQSNLPAGKYQLVRLDDYGSKVPFVVKK